MLDKPEIDLNDIITQFETAKSWESSYRLLLSIGQYLPKLDDSLKTNDNLLTGCEANVWIVVRIALDTDSIYFEADSDSKILRGILSLIRFYINTLSVEEGLQLSVTDFFYKLNILSHFSVSRKAGISAINDKIQTTISLHIKSLEP